MKNYVQPGNVVPVGAPAGGAVSGDGVLIGALFGVATTTVDAGMPLEIAINGVFDLAKTTGEAFAAGDRVYWDATAKKATSDDAGNERIGTALAAALAADTTLRVRLNGFIV